jgi:hypothetical protein
MGFAVMLTKSLFQEEPQKEMKEKKSKTKKQRSNFLKNMFGLHNDRGNMLMQQNSAYMPHNLDSSVLLSDALDLYENNGKEEDGYVPVDPPVNLSRKKTRRKTKRYQGLKSSSSLESLHEPEYEPVDIPDRARTWSRRNNSFSVSIDTEKDDVKQPPVVHQLVRRFESTTQVSLDDPAKKSPKD